MIIKDGSLGKRKNNFVLEARACTILYNFLLSNNSPFPYLLPANICPVVPITFLKAGQPFQFVDIDPKTFCLDEMATLNLIRNRKIGGVLLVHTYGELTSHSDFFSKLKEIDPKISIIDDRCLCEPDFSVPDLKDIDLIIFSTGYGKFVDVGSGGFGWLKPGISYEPSHIPFSKSDLARLEEGYKSNIQNRSVFQYHDSDWLDTRSGHRDFQSYSIKVQDALDDIRLKKTQINLIYRDLLPEQIQLPEIYNHWRFNIQVPNKTEVLHALFENHLFASTHYQSLGGIMAKGHFPFAESLHGHIINLFNDQHYSSEQAQRTAWIINQIIE